MEQAAAWKEVADGELRHLLAYNGTFKFAGVKMGDSVPIFYGS